MNAKKSEVSTVKEPQARSKPVAEVLIPGSANLFRGALKEPGIAGMGWTFFDAVLLANDGFEEQAIDPSVFIG